MVSACWRSGPARRACHVGLVVTLGSGVPQDLNEARLQFQFAADRGLAEAQYIVAIMYQEGEAGATRDDEGGRMVPPRGQPGVSPAQYELARMSTEAPASRRIPWKPLVCSSWLEPQPDAEYIIGNRYAEGIGVARDDVEAMRWYRLAADHGNSAGQYTVGFMYSTGRSVPRDDVEGLRWMRLAADQRLAVAEHEMGDRYSEGRGVTRDDAEAARWYRRAADHEYAAARYALGHMYSSGRGVAETRWRRSACIAWPRINGPRSLSTKWASVTRMDAA